jgi:hypothetical protein
MKLRLYLSHKRKFIAESPYLKQMTFLLQRKQKALCITKYSRLRSHRDEIVVDSQRI